MSKKSTKEKKDESVLVRFNSFGPIIENKDIGSILADKDDPDSLSKIEPLKQFFNRPITTLNEDILNRYIDVTKEDLHIVFIPSYQILIERIVEPLISAKRQYCLGEYLACIALSGIIGEMLAQLIWDMSTFGVRGVTLSKKGEKLIFGNKYGDLSQKRRVDILYAMKSIEKNVYDMFNDVRKKRNNYLHSWDYDRGEQKEQAKEIFLWVFELYKTIADVKLVSKDGHHKMSINPMLLKYLKESSSK